MVPIALSTGQISDGLKKAIVDYAEWIGKPIPQTEEDFIEIHPLTKFRAACFKLFNNAQVADAIISELNDCGLDIVVLAKEEKSRIIT